MTEPPTSEATPDVVETHVSVLFFVYDKVYKLRKPVQFGFVDFTGETDRRHDCEREVTLNRRLSPDVYLGVADVVIDGVPVDHMVVMRRMEAERRLAFLARESHELGDVLNEVAEQMATFHRGAKRSPDIAAAATAESLRAAWESNFSEIEPFVGSLLDEDVEKEIRSLVSRWIAGRQPLLDSRIASGHVCDGHGDLQAEDIFCLDDGVRILDCIEFSDELRYCDITADVAFLAMDLERLGRPDDAVRFLSAYESAAGEQLPPSLVHHYCASRAYVRAKVACLRFAQGSDTARQEAKQLQALALAHLRRARVTLVIVGGPPGSGKSTLASGIADARGWALLRTDEVRMELVPAPEGLEAGYQQGRYSAASIALVYEELLDRARRMLEMGESVVLDATWIEAHQRHTARAIADRTSSDLVEFRCDVDPDTAADRIVKRLLEQTDVSEATPEVAKRMSRSMQAWDSAIVIDTSDKNPERVIAAALEALPPQ